MIKNLPIPQALPNKICKICATALKC